MITIEIRFGSPDDDDLAETETLTFSTLEEANAFMLGVDMASGWSDYTVNHDGREEAR